MRILSRTGDDGFVGVWVHIRAEGWVLLGEALQGLCPREHNKQKHNYNHPTLEKFAPWFDALGRTAYEMTGSGQNMDVIPN